MCQSGEKCQTSEIYLFVCLFTYKMYLHDGENKNMTSQKEENSYQNHISLLIKSTMVMETIMVIFLFSAIFLIITTVLVWFISVTWKFCKGKVLIPEEEDDELDLPPSYSTLDLTPPEYQAMEDKELRDDRNCSWSEESSIKKRLLYERQSKLFRSLD